jgi:hypothetical protein
MKVAKRIQFDFGLRVLVEENDGDEEIREKAMDTLLRFTMEEGIYGMVTEISDDIDCPFGHPDDYPSPNLFLQNIRSIFQYVGFIFKSVSWKKRTG